MHSRIIPVRIASFFSSEGGLGAGLGEAGYSGALAQALTASRTAAMAADPRRFNKADKERVMWVFSLIQSAHQFGHSLEYLKTNYMVPQFTEKSKYLSLFTFTPFI